MQDSKLKKKEENEIDILELIRIVWDDKLRVLIVSSVAAIISVIYSLSLPNIYQSEALLVPAEDKNTGSLSRMAGQFGSLASLAGVSLRNDGASKVELGLEVLKSRKFVREFVERHKIKPQLMAIDRWNSSTRELHLDNDVYDEKTKTWLDEDGPPTNEQVYYTFIDALFIQEESSSDFVRVGFKHKSPDLAAEWTALVVQDLNDAIRRQEIKEAESSIEYLRQQINQSPLSELRKLFYGLIQSQTEIMMLANVREEYVFKTIDPAIVPENKFKPRRAVICIVGTFLGGFFAVIYSLFRHYYRVPNILKLTRVSN